MEFTVITRSCNSALVMASMVSESLSKKGKQMQRISVSLVRLMKSSTFGLGITLEKDNRHLNRLFLLMASKIQWNLLSLREVVILH